MTKPNAQEISDFLLRSFPTSDGSAMFAVEQVSDTSARLRLIATKQHLRPGASLSGPAQMGLADIAAWTCILHNLGLSAAASVTSNLSMSFLAKPAHADLIGDAQVLRLGKRTCVCEVRLYSVGQTQLVAHATISYAIAYLPADAALQSAKPPPPAV